MGEAERKPGGGGKEERRGRKKTFVAGCKLQAKRWRRD